MVFKVLQIECDDPEHTFLTERELAENLKFPLSRLMGWRKHGGGISRLCAPTACG